ncbi:MAG: radical SAM protein [Candidatus Lernaella stagnicola]|nr:radical SAM protein [Candidatus Lernaella stagnicola]
MQYETRRRFRVIIPAFPNFNIYSSIARTTTALGPVSVATVASEIPGWDVEVIDENNCRDKFCPRDKNGRPDHQRLQADRPADVVGFYASLSSTVPRVFELARFYQQAGAVTLAGGKHVDYLPEEALANGIDTVCHGEGEETTVELLQGISDRDARRNIAGISFREGDEIHRTPDRDLRTIFDHLPFPDFSLVRYANIKIYPVSRTRGCNMNCEFCSVKGKPRCATPNRTVNEIIHLIETREARKFFEASDHFTADREGTLCFCRLLGDYLEQTGVRIQMTVQVRINDARDKELLQAMKRAGINGLAIGFESPIDEELIAMKKGYLSKQMLKWTKTLKRYGFFIHGMFIFGYPHREEHRKQHPEADLSVEERTHHFKHFIRKSRIDTAQVLLAIPLPGTELRTRLAAEGRLYDLGWEYYDGQFPLYEPAGEVAPEQLQNASGQIMGKFYSFGNLWRVIINIMFYFPLMVFPAVTTLLSLRVRPLAAAFRNWYKFFFRTRAIRLGGHFIVRNWVRNFRRSDFLDRLAAAKKKLQEKSTKNTHRTPPTGVDGTHLASGS